MCACVCVWVCWCTRNSVNKFRVRLISWYVCGVCVQVFSTYFCILFSSHIQFFFIQHHHRRRRQLFPRSLFWQHQWKRGNFCQVFHVVLLVIAHHCRAATHKLKHRTNAENLIQNMLKSIRGVLNGVCVCVSGVYWQYVGRLVGYENVAQTNERSNERAKERGEHIYKQDENGQKLFV